MAGVILHARIIENTATDGRDQSHLNVHHFSRSAAIPDRTEYLLGRIPENPAWGMAEVFARAWRSLGEPAEPAVGGIPCNTFHAPEIFDAFRSALLKTGNPIKMLHMLDETMDFIATIFPAVRKPGLLATTGTRKTGLYPRLLRRSGLEALELPEALQERLQEGIYHREWGLKAASPVTELAKERVRSMARRLAEDGADAIILGCTELPLALTGRDFEGIPLIDPLTALARALIRETAPHTLKEYV